MAELPGSVGRIVQAAEERLPGLLDRMAQRIRTEVPVYEDVVDAAEHRNLAAIECGSRASGERHVTSM